MTESMLAALLALCGWPAAIACAVWGARWRRRARMATALLRSINRTANGAARRPQGVWRCTVCKEMHGPAEIAAHEHRDDPRSDYYEPPKAAP